MPDQDMSEPVMHHVEERRFEFGENWSRFLEVLNDTRIQKAEESLKQMLKVSTLRGRTFLDIGSGSGLFSLAARRLGARVHSFDYDKRSVACTRELKRRYCTDDKEWTIEEGSVLDETYMRSLGQFDVVYSWGVLHHTGAMWRAFEHVVPLVKQGGALFLAIYNDQDGTSRRWRMIKRLYNTLPHILRPFISVPIILIYEGRYATMDLLKGHNPLGSWIHSNGARGMHKVYDWIDWIGGYPFEVAKPEQVFEFYRDRGFHLVTLKTCGGRGCNEFVFAKGKEERGA
jgi:2-polyprenyl-6-hydroxyphenyl methylase/3-demethylubiquinone-9 3-methyltransferase